MALRRLDPLEGERVHRTLHPHPLGRLGSYGPGLALLALAGLLAGLATSLAGVGLTGTLDRGAGPFAVPLLLALWWAGLAACTAPFALRAAHPAPLGYGVGVAITGGFAAVLVGIPDPSAAEALAWLPVITVLAALPPLAAAELARRRVAWHFTDFRLVRSEGLLHAREQSWRLTRLERVDLERRGPRALDFGDLVASGRDGDVRIPDVRPVGALRDELEMLLHTPTEAPFLAEQRGTAERVARLLRPGEAPPR